MAAGKRFTVRTSISQEPMPVEDWHAAERVLAKLIARAYAADHPELFGPHLDRAFSKEISGSSSTARADAVAPAARDGGPEKWRVGHDG